MTSFTTMDDFPGLREDIQLVVGCYHVPESQRADVLRRWSNYSVDDRQDVFQCVGSLLKWGNPIQASRTPHTMAARDVIENSRISQVMVYDHEKDVLRYRPEIPAHIRRKIGDYVISLCPGGVATPIVPTEYFNTLNQKKDTRTQSEIADEVQWMMDDPEGYIKAG